MRANPGGYVAPAELFGREALIDRVWRVLDTRSIQLLADRRYGKSSLIRAMHERPAKGWATVLQDLEGVRTPLEFVDVVRRHAEGHLSRGGWVSGRLTSMVRDLTGIEVLGTRLPEQLGQDWKRLLHAIFEDLEEHLEGRLVFLWDEIPYMLQNVRDAAGEDTAREILDTLRAIRQHSRKTRMVFTGSIGLHHVLRSLQTERPNAQAPLNDMTAVDVPQIARADAESLAQALILGEKLHCLDDRAAATALAMTAADLPYYVHHIVDSLAQTGQPADPDTIRKRMDHAIQAPEDPLNLRHYDQRLRAYYGEREELGRAMLDVVAQDGPLPRSETMARVVATGRAASTAQALEMLDLLSIDHYLVTDEDDHVLFHNDIVRRWWRHHRIL